jgi:ankyrin repeat protein
MAHFDSVTRLCFPVLGVVVVAVLAEDQKFFRTLVLLPFGIALPLLIWSTIKIQRQVKTDHSIDIKYIVLFAFSLIVTAALICFYFMIDAALSHGAVPSELFHKNCLFTLLMIVAYPLMDVLFLRFRQKSGPENRKIRYSMIAAKAFVLVLAVFILIDIIGPPVNAALRRNHQSLAKALISKGADLNKTDRFGCAPLWYALHRADLNMTVFLLNRGAHLDNRFAGLALTRAVESRNIDMLRLLLNRGLDPDSKYMGATPLVRACLSKDLNAIRILVQKGADIHSRSSYPNMPYDGKSALDIARENGDTQITELLMSGSAKKEIN